MRRIGVRLSASAVAALCVAVCAPGAASAAGARTIAQAPGVKLNAVIRGHLYDGAFYSGYSVAYWLAGFSKGDHITIGTTASGGDTPPCQLLFMPGTDDTNVSATTPLLNPASQTRDGSHDGQRWVATRTGTYVLAMTNADVFLSGPHQCLDAPAGRPFTFTVTVSHAGGGGRSGRGRSTYVVKPGQSLWVIAQGIVGEPAGIAQVASEAGRLWALNAARIGTGDPDLIYPGQELRLSPA